MFRVDSASARLANCQVAVWYCRTESLDRAATEFLGCVLSAEERARRDRLVFDRDRRDFTVAHGLVRRVLSRYEATPAEDWRFYTDAFGKPAIVDAERDTPSLVFNLSHTHGLVACAIARDTRLGIDVERVSRVSRTREIASRYFSPGEIVMLDAYSPAEYGLRFVELWTLKEAYIKAVGRGLSLPLDSFGFVFGSASDLRFVGRDDRAWQFLLASLSADTRIALAVERDHSLQMWQVTWHDWAGEPCDQEFALLRKSVCA